MQISLNITPDYKYWILFCGLFSKTRNVVKFWEKYEQAFLWLVAQDAPGMGMKHLLQTIILYFLYFDESQQKFVSTFFKLLYDSNVFSDTFLVEWFEKKIKLDKKTILYDRKAEKAMRDLLKDFISWLR